MENKCHDCMIKSTKEKKEDVIREYREGLNRLFPYAHIAHKFNYIQKQADLYRKKNYELAATLESILELIKELSKNPVGFNEYLNSPEEKYTKDLEVFNKEGQFKIGEVVREWYEYKYNKHKR